MSSLYLKLNLSKTELLVFSPSTNLPLPDIAISVCGSTITPKQHARCLGVILDSDLSFTPHIRSLARSSYLHLKNISRIRPFLTFDSAKTLTVSLIHSRLDYCNSLLIGLPLTKLSPLQSVLNAAARIIFLTNRYTDASTLCQSLHWLPIHSRIQYKTTTLIHKALHGSAPPYISSLVSVYHPTRALRSADDLRPLLMHPMILFALAAAAWHWLLQSSSEDEEPTTSAEDPAAQKREERLRKFRELHLKRNEARKLNHQEVVEEDKRQKLPSNWEARKARLEWELKEEERKKECAANGVDYERAKLLEISADDAERWERKKRKRNPDMGFSDYAAAQLRQYQRLTRQIKPDMEEYERERETVSVHIHQQNSDLFYPTSNSLYHGTHVPSKDGVDRMVTDLEKQIAKREKYSRRRAYNDDADIDYINERNAKFNKKAERFYGKYTAEIKQNLERGTAV
ncbi:unnamed protein product [Ranitomeya imitator]|uniref:Pre-mRNA-splicing factor SYF2 n=1 Tax=Ranitomeya imitator TaxID=111125 RepID=A0ABN9MCY1_9NEOB|nr:unnamed protein product [Ranitomeya imitator]